MLAIARLVTGMLVILLVQGSAAAGPKKLLHQKYYWLVGLGAIEELDGAGLLDDGNAGAILNFGFGHRINRFLGGEIELGVAGREHPFAPPLTSDEDLIIQLSWLSYSIKLSRAVGRYEPFVAVGIGSGQMNLSFSSDDPFELPPDIEEDRGVLYHYRVGFDAAVGGKSGVGIEFRDTKMDADGGELTGGEIDVGGRSVIVTYRYRWGRWLSRH